MATLTALQAPLKLLPGLAWTTARAQGGGLTRIRGLGALIAGLNAGFWGPMLLASWLRGEVLAVDRHALVYLERPDASRRLLAAAAAFLVLAAVAGLWLGALTAACVAFSAVIHWEPAALRGLGLAVYLWLGTLLLAYAPVLTKVAGVARSSFYMSSLRRWLPATPGTYRVTNLAAWPEHSTSAWPLLRQLQAVLPALGRSVVTYAANSELAEAYCRLGFSRPDPAIPHLLLFTPAGLQQQHAATPVAWSGILEQLQQEAGSHWRIALHLQPVSGSARTRAFTDNLARIDVDPKWVHASASAVGGLFSHELCHLLNGDEPPGLRLHVQRLPFLAPLLPAALLAALMTANGSVLAVAAAPLVIFAGFLVSVLWMDARSRVVEARADTSAFALCGSEPLEAMLDIMEATSERPPKARAGLLDTHPAIPQRREAITHATSGQLTQSAV